VSFELDNTHINLSQFDDEIGHLDIIENFCLLRVPKDI
jgi:hypothetical protein